MKTKTVFITVASFSAALLIFSQIQGPGAVAAQQANAPAPQCVPAAQEVPGGGGARGAAGARQGQPAAARGQAAQAPVPRDATITAIPGVVAAGAKWTKIWQQAGNSADG